MKVGNDLEFYSKTASVNGNNLSVAVSKFVPGQATGQTVWQDNTDTIDGNLLFADQFEFGPRNANEEIALAVLLNGVVVEKWVVSLDPANKNEAGENNYISEFLDAKSSYIWGFAKTNAYADVTSFTDQSLVNGTGGDEPSTGDLQTAYETFVEKNDIKFDYIIDGNHSDNRQFIINNIADVRKDCIAFVGPKLSDIVGISNSTTIVNNLIADRQSLGNSTHAAYFGNYKLIRDNIQGKNLFIPFTGDVAGNKVRVNTEREAWIPAAGNTNGRLKNVAQLAFNPKATEQTRLYNNGINHIVFKPGKGFVIDGQKTMTDQNIGVSRIHVRDLFRIIEDFVAGAAEDFLQEFNNLSTRNRFLNVVNPFIEDIQNRGGIIDFEVVADESLNTPAVVDSGGFRAEVKIKAQRAIEEITITFFDVPTGVDFSEIGN